ncbi:MAG: type II toxin-antitoxin system VapC family toxin [Synergistaceae bacterium]|jgi:predicted nucleic acid-binding protein|nr:type II toxin-antitoxin system VapC family toxin [Synergistaceae bacterium]
MKKLRLYLDTSVISHLDAPDRLDWQEDTRRLWENIRAGMYDVFVSPVVVAEIERCKEPKRSYLLAQLRLIEYVVLEKTDEIGELAQRYVDANILRPNSFDDCQHIAYACVYNCDMLLSWNFAHLVNVKTISGVKGVNVLTGYKEMPIYTPTMLISGGADDET